MAIADRLSRCQINRTTRRGSNHEGWPWRCRSGGCWSCRRTRLNQAWAGAFAWSEETASHSHAIIPALHDEGDVRGAVRRLRRELRRLRDRRAAFDARWATVAMCGLQNAQIAQVIVRHPDLPHHQISAALRLRWPGAMAVAGQPSPPDGHISSEDAAALAVARRGVEPLRVWIGARASLQESEIQPMPLMFS